METACREGRRDKTQNVGGSGEELYGWLRKYSISSVKRKKDRKKKRKEGKKERNKGRKEEEERN